MAELTKTDNRQPIGKIKPTDKMVMMPSLFDGTKPEMSKQHYERFNLYIMRDLICTSISKLKVVT